MLNGVLKHLVINHDGIILLGLMYVFNRFAPHCSLHCLFPQCDCMSKRRRRSVTCVRLGTPVSDRDCIHEPKPDEIVSCYDECNNPHWETHLWEPVSSRSICSKEITFISVVLVHSHLFITSRCSSTSCRLFASKFSCSR